MSGMPNLQILWPIVFEGVLYDITVTANSVQEVVSLAVSANRNYWVSGDGVADAVDDNVGGVGDLLQVLEDALNDHSELGTATVTMTTGGVIVIDFDGVTADIVWTEIPAEMFGFDDDTTSGTSATSTQLPLGMWRPNRAIGLDSRDRQPVVGGMAASVSGKQRCAHFAWPRRERDITVSYITPAKALQEYEAAAGESWESAWVDGDPDADEDTEEAFRGGIGSGSIFRLYPDEEDDETFSYYMIRDLDEPLNPMDNPIYWWALDLRMRLIVPAGIGT